MELAEYEVMHRVEDSHWWYKGMSSITRALIEYYYAGGGPLRILDAGCGTGAALSWLSEYGTVTGFDISSHALHFCKTRGHEQLVAASVMAIPFTGESFDLVTSLDVLYFDRIQDNLALQEISRILVPGGRVVLRVPAYNWLRGIHDQKVSTGHRYTLWELGQKMKRNGLVPEIMTYVNTILFPLALLKRLCEKWLPPQSSSDIALDLKGLGRLLKGCLALESRLITRWSLPFGLSIMGVGQKPH